jgi:chromodomain-helicase-DNA-binding protein 4
MSDSDSSSGQRPRRRRAGRVGARGSSDDSESEAEPTSTDEGDTSKESHTVGRRSLRISAKRQEQNLDNRYVVDSEDDSGSGPRRSGRQRTKKIQQTFTSGRGKRESRRSTIESGSDYHVAGARRSERTRDRPRRCMRERQEDEISTNSEYETSPKVVATKEQFHRLPGHDPFRQRHRQVCDTCGWQGDDAQKGPLVFCQGCTNAYHQQCLGPRGSRDHLVTKVAENNFVLQCRRCIGLAHQKDHTAPDHGVCAGCDGPGKVSKPFRARLSTRREQLQREENGGTDPITVVDMPLNAVENVMFRCASCQRGWHMQHLPRREEAHQNEREDHELDERQLAQRRFDSYHGSWTCKDCVEHPTQIDALVAWRLVDIDSYVPGMAVDMVAESAKEYLVKWKNQSHFRTTWMLGSWVWGIAAVSTRTAFMKKDENRLPKMTTEDAIPEDFFRVDIVFDVRYTSVVGNSTKEIDLARVGEVETAYVKYKGLGYEDTVWETPPRPDDGERWLDFKTAYEEWVLKRYISIPGRSSLSRHLAAIRTQNFEQSLMKRSQPSSMTGGKMMGYQMEGLNWLYYQWFICQNAILADEMGLGKTIQIIALFATLVQDHKCWPFLVIVPNSTCPNWRREIRKWVPSLRAVTYFGSEKARTLAHDYELFPHEDEVERTDQKDRKRSRSDAPKDIKAHVVIASYESIVEEKAHRSLQKVPWAGLIVDEGQRLKSDKTQMYDALSKLRIQFRVLLTGTPLQNNARELFNLLQFLDSKIDAHTLETKYETLTQENVPELHEMIRPFFLRRTKAQVLTFLPPMAQIILPVTMSVVQKKVYKSILSKNPRLMKAIFSRDGQVATKERHNLNNILMQLRKTLCHPFVYSREIEDRSHEAAVSHRNLVEASSKLQLLSIMLPKLQERGHRVLIFSQFLDNLDIIEDFLDGLGLQHRRLDGNISSLEKQKRIDEFNAPDSPYFAFLLSTRAGGVGINLATADTVIIMDPDFNPHQDIQALSRVHRIGQKNKVWVFQIMTRGSVEEKIMQIGKKKMALDHILIQQMDQEDEAGMDLESILRHGAAALFEDDNTGDIHYDSASVDKLLDRSQVENTGTGDDKSAESQFSFARIWANDTAALEDGLVGSGDSTPNPTVWDRILQERERAYAEEVALHAETLGRGKRRRQNVDYGQGGDGLDVLSPVRRPKHMRAENASDTDFQAQGADSDENDTGGYKSAYHTREEVEKGVQANGHAPAASPATPNRGPPSLTQPTGKGKRGRPTKSSKSRNSSTPMKYIKAIDRSLSSTIPTSPLQNPTSLTTLESPLKSSERPNAYFSAARPFKHVKVPSGPAPHFNVDGPSDYVTLGGLPSTHLCSACDEVHPMGWCRLKVAGIEHCGLCGLAHIGHGRTCPHLNSEVQVATLLGTLKESTESKELIEQATKYLRMIRGDLVQRKRKQEAQARNQPRVLGVPAYAKMNGGEGPPLGTFTVSSDGEKYR